MRQAFDGYHIAPASRVDDAIKRALAQPQQTRWKLHLAVGLAAAAGLALAFVLPSMLGNQSPQAGSRGANGVVQGDVVATDGTIIDAFKLAIQIERGESGLMDVTGDGVVDCQDVDALAMKAVKLGGRS